MFSENSSIKKVSHSHPFCQHCEMKQMIFLKIHMPDMTTHLWLHQTVKAVLDAFLQNGPTAVQEERTNKLEMSKAGESDLDPIRHVDLDCQHFLLLTSVDGQNLNKNQKKEF